MIVSNKLIRYKQLNHDIIALHRAIANLRQVQYTESSDLCQEVAETLNKKVGLLTRERNKLEKEIDFKLVREKDKV